MHSRIIFWAVKWELILSYLSTSVSIGRYLSIHYASEWLILSADAEESLAMIRSSNFKLESRFLLHWDVWISVLNGELVFFVRRVTLQKGCFYMNRILANGVDIPAEGAKGFHLRSLRSFRGWNGCSEGCLPHAMVSLHAAPGTVILDQLCDMESWCIMGTEILGHHRIDCL